ncbi:MAG: EMC3/TMCO1 family protein, partial [Candidatus Bathyarchaeota archaeon]
MFPTLPEWLLPIPNSTFFILLLSMSLSFLTALANRLLTNREQLSAWRKEVAQWNQDFKKARKAGDQKLLAKVKKKERHILSLQSKMMWQSMKVSLIFMIPFLLIWQVIIASYQ